MSKSDELNLRDTEIKLTGSFRQLKVRNACIDLDEFDLEFIYANLDDNFKGKVVSDRGTSIKKMPNGQITITTVKDNKQKNMTFNKEDIFDVRNNVWRVLKLMINTECDRVGIERLIPEDL